MTDTILLGKHYSTRIIETSDDIQLLAYFMRRNCNPDNWHAGD